MQPNFDESMIYPHTFEEKIGFDSIRALLSEKCVSDMGRAEVDDIQYATSLEEVNKKLLRTNEFKSVLLFDDPFPAQDFNNLLPTLSRIAIDGTHIELDELGDLRNLINAVIQSVVYFRIRHEDGKYPNLWELCQNMALEKELLNAINRILDPKGNLRNDASDELSRIRAAIIRISNDADRKIRKLLTVAKQDGIVKEDAEMTVRNGRLCIPVQAQFKRRLQGFIHDESATGQTVFIEPTEIFSANNELKDLLNAEKREIIRILTTLTDQIRLSIPNLRVYHDFIGQIDLIRAKALFAIDIQAGMPHLTDTQIIHLHKAKHPLLYLKFQNLKKEVQPLELELTPQQRILIISGPNAGGKSVCLKTIGLLQYMMQCGLLVPADETSEMGVFNDFFIDMGDEQSIENDLSTYSSHLRNLKVMLEKLNERSLFLIDEFGSGTEPTLGAAMAEAVLEKFYDSKSFGVVTTHYGNLKIFPDTHPESVNGAMLFDTTELRPLFMLKIGNPGSSFTYEIAAKIGFPQEVIDSAMQKSGTAQIDYERKLQEIEVEKLEIDKELRLVHSADEQLALMMQDYGEKFSELDKRRKEILQSAKNQATSIIENANKLIEKTIRDIKEAKADPVKTRAIRKEAERVKEALRKEIDEFELKEGPKPVVPLKYTKPKRKPVEKNQTDPTIHVGDSVYMIDIQTVGEVSSINGDDVVVNFNSVSFRTSLKKLTKISKKEAKDVRRRGVRMDGGTLSEALNQKISQFKTQLDIRGTRADETIPILEDYIDEAVLLSIHQVKILHGKGNGVLRNIVRQYLAKRKEVISFRDEDLQFGGYGITVVDL
ncbi:MAG: Smr/MutS family protein [Bacteroidales bacterium]|nr:Smr/MutS family protein [Bacteroidales bacterium]